jgi:[acyl-carrier-protein] S-malonyltransferase
MLRPWVGWPGAKSLVTELSEVAGIDLVEKSANASDEELKKTEIAQPLLLATALLSWGALNASSAEGTKVHVAAVAGHSVGEFAASVIADVLSPTDAMRLVKLRGNAMAKASKTPETGMAAVLGGDEAAVIAAIEQCDLHAANINAQGQIVAAGLLTDLAKLPERVPDGCRVRPLTVAGAFHTKFMSSALEEFDEAAKTTNFRDPKITFVSNDAGKVLATGEQIREHLTNQIARPVNWLACQRTFAKIGIEQIIELAPGNTLSAIAKRETPNITARPIASLMPS